MEQQTASNAAPATKNDLYAHLGDELTNDNGMSLGTLDRVRAAYDFCEFKTQDGKTVRRDVDDILNFANNGYSFD